MKSFAPGAKYDPACSHSTVKLHSGKKCSCLSKLQSVCSQHISNEPAGPPRTGEDSIKQLTVHQV